MSFRDGNSGTASLQGLSRASSSNRSRAYAFDNQSRRVSRGREQYREIAEKLYQLGERTDLPGAKETQKAILLHLAEEMHRFPAFLEELQKRFPDLVEIPKQ